MVMRVFVGIARALARRRGCPRLARSCAVRLPLRKTCPWLRRPSPRPAARYARRVVTARSNVVERLRTRVLAHAVGDGHVTLHDPQVCFFRYSAPTTFVKAASYGVTLGVVVQGQKRVRVGDRELVVDPQNALVFTGEIEHAAAIIAATPERPFLGVALCFPPERVARSLVALADAGGAPRPPDTGPAFALPLDDAIVDTLARLLHTLDDPLDRRVLAPLVGDELLYRLLRSDAAAALRHAVGAAADSTRILESMQYIRANLARKLSVDALARRAAMSPSHFAHRFSAVARTSPMRYLREVRLERARALLFETGARAGDVGVQVGFESAAHFAREFKRRYGAPPSRFAQSALRA
jgi:AraC-like DNA-binding protein